MSILLDTMQGKPASRPPVWFMRQAGRVLPSYNALKENYTFWQLMKSPELAAKVTLLPVYDLGVDAAILFSDILVIPYAMGMGLDFTDKGPVFEKPLMNVNNPVQALNPDSNKLEYIYNAIDEIIKTKPADIPLIGFCGAPLTVMCFMFQGLGTRSNFSDAEKIFLKDKQLTKKVAEAVTELSIEYALKQIERGISVFQLFDTHAGIVPFDYYQEVFMPMVNKIGDAVRNTGTPFIFFPKGIGAGLTQIGNQTCDFLSIDWQTPLPLARKLIDPKVGLQGNLDPRILFADEITITNELEKLKVFRDTEKKWIFNLGHGLQPGIPVENVKFVIDYVKQTDWQ